VLADAEEFDIIHFHTDLLQFAIFANAPTPCLTTLHGRLDLPDLAPLHHHFREQGLVSISDAQRNPLPDANWAATVYHGLPENLLTPNYEPKGYLAFLGRITPDKGPETAIQLARAAGLPLKIAAKIVRSERRYFTQRIEPLLDGTDVEFVGEIDDAHKAEFLGNAAALLFPIDWPEPFGLVMIEAMACGTPVVAFRCGSVPEVIDDGMTGYTVEPDGGLEAIDRAVKLDRMNVRRRFEERFTARRMAQDYVGIYERVVEGAPRPPNTEATELRMCAG